MPGFTLSGQQATRQGNLVFKDDGLQGPIEFVYLFQKSYACSDGLEAEHR